MAVRYLVSNLRKSVWVVLMLLGTGVPTFAGSAVPDSASEDWAGVIEERPMPDGSTLFEYSAQTSSSSVEGASLSLSFIPRFNCQPTLYLRLPNNYWPGDVDSVVTLKIVFNDQIHQYQALIDEEPGFRTYSISTSAKEFDVLRQLVDESTRASFQLTQGAEQSANQQDALRAVGDTSSSTDAALDIEYSLLGSRYSAKATERFCEQHQPIPFTGE